MARLIGALEPPNDGLPVRLKVWILGGIVLVLFGILTVQLVRLQLLRGEEYAARADINRVRTYDIAPSRGLIMTRDGTPLVENVPAYRIILIPADVPDGEEAALAETLSEVFDRPDWEIAQEILERKASNDPLRPLVIADDPTNSVVFDISTRRADLPGVQIETVSKRRYQHSEQLAHVVGYIHWITEAEYEALSDERYLYSDKIGQTGLEASYESVLRGVPGRRQVEVDAVGRELGVLSAEEPLPGDSLVVSIDLELQSAVQEILERHRRASYYAAAVVLKVDTGEVLSLVSIPTYDLNSFQDGLTPEQWAAMNDPDRQPLRNHAIADAYPPGSTFKVITAAAALANGAATPETLIYSPGELVVDNELNPGIQYVFSDTVQGTYDLRRALSESSNVYFFYLAGGEPFRHPDAPPRPEGEQEALDALAEEGIVAGDVEFNGVGPLALAEWAREFGFDDPTGIDLAGEVGGLIPDPALKQRTFGEPWVDGDTYNFAIGQGFVAATPLQMAVATATIANGGTIYEPQIVYEVRDSRGNLVRPFQPIVRRQLEIDPEALRVIREGMALSTLAGTSHDALVALPEMMIAGKTGTAEFAQTGPATGEEGMTHGWFIAFAPFDDPEIAIAVFFEFGAGYLAAAAGGEVLRAWAELSGAIEDAVAPPYARVAITDAENERLFSAIRARSPE